MSAANPTGLERVTAMAAGKWTLPIQPMPKIPDAIKNKFPDLKPYWEQYERDLEEWRKSLMLNTGTPVSSAPTG